jgi:7,8-didemethyl-8-hydroxy-5-deazariboflavin synthase CofH subunit
MATLVTLNSQPNNPSSGKTVDLHWDEISLEESWRRARPETARPLERLLEGRELSYPDGLHLAGADGDDLIAVVKTADELRRRVSGPIVSYVVNRNINFTNVCIVGCRFCGFGRAPHAEGAYFHSPEAVVAKAREAWDQGATEVCIQGGLPRDLDGYYYRDLLLALKAELPDLHIHAFSPMEIVYGVEKTRLPLREYLLMLKEAGLNSIPGTAAEVLDDDLRRVLSQNKLKVFQWLEVIKTAHRVGIPTTSTLMYGHIEEPRHWISHLLLLRNIQKETGGFTEFVPLGFIHEKTRLFQNGKCRSGSSLREDLLVHALARLLLHGWISNVQVSWVKLGFDVSLACLKAGANDFGGTLMEESISKSAGATFGEYVSPEEFRHWIRKIGRVPAERTTSYKLRRVFDQPEKDSAPTPRPRPSAPGHQPYSGTGY